MTIAKTELLIALLESRGAEIEDAKEAAERDVHQSLGALRALTLAQSNLEGLLPGAKRSLEAAGCDLKQQEAGVKEVQRCIGSLISMANTARVHGHKMQGRAELLAEQVKVLSKEVAAEREKLEAQRTAASGVVVQGGERGAPGRRTPGVHPGPSLKVVRQAEVEQKPKPPAKKKAARKKRASAKRKPNGRADA